MSLSDQTKLEKEIKSLQTKLVSTNDLLQKLKDKEAIPLLKKKFEKKYFKYKNCYSCPQKKSDYWYLYSEVLEVKREEFFVCNTFQKTKEGRIEVRHNPYVSINCLGEEITKSEFNRARKRILDSINKIIGDKMDF